MAVFSFLKRGCVLSTWQRRILVTPKLVNSLKVLFECISLGILLEKGIFYTDSCRNNVVSECYCLSD